MWHEARKQEKKIRSMMVDHQKRADRRRQFYEKIVSCVMIFRHQIYRLCITNDFKFYYH